ncbi:MAG: acylphosphatase [Candidatus Heimdallarchaeota archaeon]|nr:acylphosphatase [Candidatus Heimdallarchaeota archaeon]
MTDLKRVKLRIHGIVQGVFYRTSAVKLAKQLNLVGWIKNRADSTVECIAEGRKEDLEKFIEWCQTGSTHSKVERTDVEWMDFKDEFREFKIEHY